MKPSRRGLNPLTPAILKQAPLMSLVGLQGERGGGRSWRQTGRSPPHGAASPWLTVPTRRRAAIWWNLAAVTFTAGGDL